MGWVKSTHHKKLVMRITCFSLFATKVNFSSCALPLYNRNMNTTPMMQNLTPNAVRITHSHPSQNKPMDRPWFSDILLEVPDSENHGLEIFPELNNGIVKIKDKTGKVIFSEKQNPLLKIKKQRPYFYFDIPQTAFYSGFHHVKDGIQITLIKSKTESFYGWGEWFNSFERVQGQVNLDNRNALFGEQHYLTYSGLPFFISSAGYGFLLLNSFRSHWTITNHTMTIEADGPNADYIIIYGPGYKEILRTYTALTGRSPLIPRWGFGLWLTSYPQESQDNVIQNIVKHREKRIPLDAVILDYHWEEKFHNFKWRKKLIPDPLKLISDLKREGTHLGLILTSFLNTTNRPLQKWILNTFGQNVTPGLEKDDERSLEEFEEANARGFLAHKKVNWWFGAGGMIDFTNPDAVIWWQEKLRPLFEIGTDFIKNDDGEDLPDDAASFNGMDGQEFHNIYGFYYGRATYQANKTSSSNYPDSTDPQKGNLRNVIYSRNVWVGSQRYPALFLGDQQADFEGIKRSIRAGLNLAASGFSYWTADIFGLSGKTTPEIHMRYAQWALLSPIARYFVRPEAIDNTRFPWSHNMEVENNFRKYTNLRMQLIPYYNTLAHQSYRNGIPLMYPPLFEFPEDERLRHIDNQLMLGNSLMICPVVEKGAIQRKIILPVGIWHDFWSENSWEGPTEIEYQAPLTCLPILVRGGTIFPLGPVIQNVPDGHQFNILEFHIWPPFPAIGNFFDDDGCSTDYQRDLFTHTQLEAKCSNNELVVQINTSKEDFEKQDNNCTIHLIVHHQQLAKKAFINNKQIPIQSNSSTFQVTFEHQIKKDASMKVIFQL